MVFRRHGVDLASPKQPAAGPDAASRLPRAAELAASVGGHLTVGTGPSTSFLLRLPLPAAR